MSSEMIEIGIRAAREFGFPCLVLAVVLWLLREGAHAMHRTVVVPVVESHSSFLKQTAAAIDGLGRTQEQQAETLRELAAGQREIHAIVARPKA